MSFVVTAQHRNVSSPIMGMANHTGSIGVATSPLMIHSAIKVRKKIFIRYMPKVSLARLLIHRGAFWMQLNSRKEPKVASNTLGVQNSHDHSIIGVSSCAHGYSEPTRDSLSSQNSTTGRNIDSKSIRPKVQATRNGAAKG